MREKGGAMMAGASSWQALLEGWQGWFMDRPKLGISRMGLEDRRGCCDDGVRLAWSIASHRAAQAFGLRNQGSFFPSVLMLWFLRAVLRAVEGKGQFENMRHCW